MCVCVDVRALGIAQDSDRMAFTRLATSLSPTGEGEAGGTG